MPFYENLTEFSGKPVTDWTAETGIADPTGTIYRIGLSYDESEEDLHWTDKFAQFLNDPAAGQITGLVVGGWEGMIEMESDTSSIVEALVAARERFPHLTALFLGDITSEECEISWLQQSDISPLFDAYSKLEYFTVRGGAGLSVGTIRHDRLKSLVVQAGGLPAAVVREVGAADLPALEHLELWLGTSNYGGDVTVEDLAPILNGERLPRLTYLGLRDSEIADDVAVAVASAPIMQRIRALDLSQGTLGDVGAEALLASPAIKRLERLDLHHHYCSPEMVSRLENLGIPVDLSGREDEDEYGRYVAVSE